MPDNENVKQDQNSLELDKKANKEVTEIDKNEGQTQNGTIGGTGSDLEKSAEFKENKD